VKKKSKNPSILNFLIVAVPLLVLTLFISQTITSKKIECANSISCKKPPKFELVKNATGIYNNQLISVPNILLSQNEVRNSILGVKTPKGEKRIYVNLATQTLYAYEGNDLFMKTPISSGLWGKTPKGDFTIWVKFVATRMSGGSGADYYDLPNVPYVMFFSNDEVPGSAGFSLHGTYWHNNFGHAMSHGCVNMKTTDAAKIFEWTEAPIGENKGTKITIYGDQPV